MNKYVSLFLIATLSSIEAIAQLPTIGPRLVVTIAIDGLNSDDLEQFSPLYHNKGFKRLWQEGRIYENVEYGFQNLDIASSLTAITTGTTPYYNGIIGQSWLNRSNLRPREATFDEKYLVSPSAITCSTLGDELKIATTAKGLVYSVAKDKSAAVLVAGHSANGAFWKDENTGNWTTSSYYPKHAKSFIDAYNRTNSVTYKFLGTNNNADVGQLALSCINDNALGRDAVSDLLFITLSAKNDNGKDDLSSKESAYKELDSLIGELISRIEDNVGRGNTLYYITSTGYIIGREENYIAYNIPSGTFYINRTTNLLNMYLSAIYGQARYVDGTYNSEIYLNRSLLEQRRISTSEVLRNAREFLIMSAGVKEVYSTDMLLFEGNAFTTIRNGYNPTNSGDILIKTSPGWQVINEETREQYISNTSYIPFPIIVFGAGTKAEKISSPVVVEQIAPSIARAMRIRAPNACKVKPLP